MADVVFSDACAEALAVQRAAAQVGFDWPDVSGVLEKLIEEVEEIRLAIADQSLEHAKRELGDLLFTAVNLARFLQADPTSELSHATARFCHRFSLLKQELAKQGRAVEQCKLEELDLIWESIKNS